MSVSVRVSVFWFSAFFAARCSLQQILTPRRRQFAAHFRNENDGLVRSVAAIFTCHTAHDTRKRARKTQNENKYFVCLLSSVVVAVAGVVVFSVTRQQTPNKLNKLFN